MQRVLEMMLEAILDTWAAVAPYLRAALAEVPVWAWASIATLILLWMAIRMLRPTRVEAGAAPDLLLTRVELTADGPSSARFQVDLGFSNLHHAPVQLLRMAAIGRAGRPVVRDVPAIVAGRRAVDLRSEVELLPGGRGRLDLYAMVPSSPARAWRVRVPLAWEPFARRYAGVLLEQSVTAVRRLPNVDEGMAAVVPSRTKPEERVAPSDPAPAPAPAHGSEPDGRPARGPVGGPAPARAASVARSGAGTARPSGALRRGSARAGAARASLDADAVHVPEARIVRFGTGVVASETDAPAGEARADDRPAAQQPDLERSDRDERRAPAAHDEAELDEGGAATPRTPRLRFPDRF